MPFRMTCPRYPYRLRLEVTGDVIGYTNDCAVMSATTSTDGFNAFNHHGPVNHFLDDD